MDEEEKTYRAWMKETLGEIKEQTKKTNGHVAEAQRDVASLKQWRAFITGGLSILSLLVVPILLYIVTKGL